VPRLESVHQFRQFLFQLLFRVDTAGVAHEAEAVPTKNKLRDPGCDRAVPRFLAADRAALNHDMQYAIHHAGSVFRAVVVFKKSFSVMLRMKIQSRGAGRFLRLGRLAVLFQPCQHFGVDAAPHLRTPLAWLVDARALLLVRVAFRRGRSHALVVELDFENLAGFLVAPDSIDVDHIAQRLSRGVVQPVMVLAA